MSFGTCRWRTKASWLRTFSRRGYSSPADAGTHSQRGASQVLIGSTELLTPERALQRFHCSPSTREDLEYETGTLEGSMDGNPEPSKLDACLDQIPLERIFPCCFRSEVSLPTSRGKCTGCILRSFYVALTAHATHVRASDRPRRTRPHCSQLGGTHKATLRIDHL